MYDFINYFLIFYYNYLIDMFMFVQKYNGALNVFVGILMISIILFKSNDIMKAYTKAEEAHEKAEKLKIEVRSLTKDILVLIYYMLDINPTQFESKPSRAQKNQALKNLCCNFLDKNNIDYDEGEFESDPHKMFGKNPFISAYNKTGQEEKYKNMHEEHKKRK